MLHTLVPVARAEGERGARLGIERGGILAAEGMLWARLSMFHQVYFHRTRRILDRHLTQFLGEALDGGQYPRELADYLDWTDPRVWELLRARAAEPGCPGHGSAVRILSRRQHRCLPQELEADDGARIREWLERWRESILQVQPNADPIADVVLPPPEAESGTDLPVIFHGGSVRPLGEVSALVGRLRQRPLGRMYVDRDCRGVPDFPPKNEE